MLKNNRLEINKNDSALFASLDDKSAEKICGGVESFQIINELGRDVKYSIDGSKYYTQKKDSTITWVTTSSGQIKFDTSFEPGYQDRVYNLSDEYRYVFKYDLTTDWNTADFNLYTRGKGLA